MKSFIKKISHLIGETVDLIVHLGAGPEMDLTDYDPLNPKMIILVEGDPELADFQERTLSSESCRVIPLVITAFGGSVNFRRYNLPALNGPLPLGELHEVYPRVQELEQVRLDSGTLSQLFQDLSVTKGKKNLLVLNVPGQETALLHGFLVQKDLPFEWIVIRGGGTVLQEGAESIEKSVACLEKLFFEKIVSDCQSDPIWPIAFLRFNSNLASVNEELEERTKALVEKAREIQVQGERIEGLNQEIAVREERVRGMGEELKMRTQRNSELERELEAKRGEIEGASEELENRAKALVEKARELQVQGERIEGLNQEMAAREERVNERIILLEQELHSKVTLIEVLTKGRHLQEELYTELQDEKTGLSVHVGELLARITELENEAIDRERCLKKINAEFHKVEGQIEIIKEVFL